MTDRNVVAERPMAKKQRTIQLPEDVYRLTDGFESGSGARFNRQLLAALLQYFFSRPTGPDPYWMELAVAVENGKLTVGDMPSARMEAIVADAMDNPPPTALISTSKLANGTEVRHLSPPFPKEVVAEWKRILDRAGADPLQKIIDHWSEGRRKR